MQRDARKRPAPHRIQITLFDLIQVLAEVTDDEQEIVSTVIHMVRTGRVRLTGSFGDRILPAA